MIISFIFSGCANAFAEGSGHVSIEEWHTFNFPHAPVASDEGRAQFEYDQRSVFSDSLSFRFHPYAYSSTNAHAWQSQSVIDPRDLYLSIESKERSSFVRLGYFTPQWEGTDGLNPMDIASMKDWGDPLNLQTRASGGIAVGANNSVLEFEAAWIPEQTQSMLPGETSAWLPRQSSLPLRTDALELRFPNQVDYRLLSRQELNDALKNNFAARLQFHGDLGDAAIAYFDGAAQSPIIKPVLDVDLISLSPTPTYRLRSPVSLLPIDYRRRTTAILLSTTLSSFIIRLSSRYDQPFGDDANIPTWSQETVFGIEKSLSFAGHVLTLILQESWVRHPEGESLLNIEDVFDHALLFGVRAGISEKWTATLSSVYRLQDHSDLLNLDIERRLNGEWKANLIFQSLDGPDNSLLGILRDNSRADIKLTRAF